jgi:hypothetical protein
MRVRMVRRKWLLLMGRERLRWVMGGFCRKDVMEQLWL